MYVCERSPFFISLDMYHRSLSSGQVCVVVNNLLNFLNQLLTLSAEELDLMGASGLVCALATVEF